MKFGLFCMVQGYLHAMTLVKREKEAWSGKGDLTGREINPGGSAGSKQERIPTTVERKKMIQVFYLTALCVHGVRVPLY